MRTWLDLLHVPAGDYYRCHFPLLSAWKGVFGWIGRHGVCSPINALYKSQTCQGPEAIGGSQGMAHTTCQRADIEYSDYQISCLGTQVGASDYGKP